jgi:two-component system chemotaxis sensor kinase CheA
MSSEQDFNIRLLQIFRSEAREHRLTILSALQELELGTETERETELVEKCFRAAHTLKGAARAVTESQIAGLCQSLEGVFSLLRNRPGQIGTKMFGAFHAALDSIEKMEAGSGDADLGVESRLNDLRRALEHLDKE